MNRKDFFKSLLGLILVPVLPVKKYPNAKPGMYDELSKVVVRHFTSPKYSLHSPGVRNEIEMYKEIASKNIRWKLTGSKLHLLPDGTAVYRDPNHKKNIFDDGDRTTNEIYYSNRI